MAPISLSVLNDERTIPETSSKRYKFPGIKRLTSFNEAGEPLGIVIYTRVGECEALFGSYTKLSREIDRVVVLLDWSNDHVEQYVKDCKIAYKNPFFILMPSFSKDVQEELVKTVITFRANDNEMFPLEVLSFYKQMAVNNDESGIFKCDDKIFEYRENLEEELIYKLTSQYAKMYYYGSKSYTSQNILVNYFLIDSIGEKLKLDPSPAYEYSQIFRKYITTNQEVQKKALKDKLAEIQRDTMNHYIAITRNERMYSEHHIVMRTLLGQQTEYNQEKLTVTKLREMFTELLKDKYESFSFNKTEVIGRTKEVVIKYLRYKFHVGKFEIVISLNGEVRMYNTTKRFGTNDHPHVDNGIPCLGNIKETIPKMIFQGDYLGLLSLLHDFLLAYNPDGPYTKLTEGWGDGTIKKCEECESILEECECSRCSYCEELDDNCSCNRCEHCDYRDDECECPVCAHCDEKKPECSCEKCASCENPIDDCGCERCEACSVLMEDCECVRCPDCNELQDECECEEDEPEEDDPALKEVDA